MVLQVNFIKNLVKNYCFFFGKSLPWALNHGQWAHMWCNSIVTVIHKEGKNPTNC